MKFRFLARVNRQYLEAVESLPIVWGYSMAYLRILFHLDLGAGLRNLRAG